MEKKKSKKTKGLKSENQVINLNSVDFEEKVKICPLCGKPYKGWGNNPYPLEMDMVCDDCNMNVIIPLGFGIDIKSFRKVKKFNCPIILGYSSKYLCGIKQEINISLIF